MLRNGDIVSSLSSAGHNPWLVSLAIVSATFVHEDLTTIAVGIAVSEGAVDVYTGLPALLLGIILGDWGLYWLGRLAALNHSLARFLDRNKVETAKHWIDKRLILGIFVVRFIPGLRLSGYTAYGFFCVPFFRFALAVVIAVCVWTSGLYYLAFTFGVLTQRLLGYWQWPTIALAFLAPMLLVQYFVRRRGRARHGK
jgi:membrane protein DedA with SNARE-associated domain